MSPSGSAVFPIRISSAKLEGVLQVSKWLKVQVFLDTDEMQEFLKVLAPVEFVVVSGLVRPEQAILSSAFFQEKYADYVSLLKQGQIPCTDHFRPFFSTAMTRSLDVFYAIAAGDGRYLIKPLKPVVQLQAHHFFYSNLDHKFHPMVLSEDSVTWGLQFAYPQLYQDPKTRQVIKVTDSSEFPNSALFSRLLKWIRSATLPTPFEVGGVRTNSPIRIGKKAYIWIKNHPQLQRDGISMAPIGSQL
jgi:hypothetical protein